jgi:hypothetical protein
MGWDLGIWATLALCAGPILFLRGFRDLRLRRLIQDTPTARIRSMAMGRVEIHGRAAERSSTTAPFSNRPCVYWQVDIAVRRRNGWTTVHRNASRHPFYIRDETGLALVYPEGATCKLDATASEVCLGVNLPDCYASYMKEQKIALRNLYRMSSLRFREFTLLDDQLLYVLGTAMPRAQSVTLSDGLAATGTDGAVQHHFQEIDEEAGAVIRQGRNDRTLIISEHSESSLTLELGLFAFGKLMAGPALTLFGLGYWLMALGK